MVGEKILQYMFKRKQMGVIMNGNTCMTINNDVVTVDTLLLFRRSLAVSLRDYQFDLKEVFKYEFSTIPVSLLDKDNLMLKADKPLHTILLGIWLDLAMSSIVAALYFR